MDNIDQEHDIFQRDVNKEMDSHPLLVRINEWEEESINKIQQMTKQARIDWRKLIDQSKKDLKISMNQLTNDLQSSRDSEDYTAIDLKRWIDRLKELRNELENPLTLNIIDDDDKLSIIRLIKVSEQLDLHSSNRLIFSERFEKIDGKCVLSENGLVATCVIVDVISGSIVHGNCYYSNGVHHIHFQIEHKQNDNLFFDIITHGQANAKLAFAALSANGWWKRDYYIKDGILSESSSTTIIKKGDDVTLILDCDHREIRVNHHRTQQMAKISIDLQKCPSPWQILITLDGVSDFVRILNKNYTL